MSKDRKILGKSLRSILEEEISPDKVLYNSKTRVNKDLKGVKKSFYCEYLKTSGRVTVVQQDCAE